MGEEECLNLISDRSCVSIAIHLKQLRASVSTCSFQTQHAVFQIGEYMHWPACERLPFGQTIERLGVTGGGNSQVTAWLHASVFQLYHAAASTCKSYGSDHMRFKQSSATIQPKLLVYQHLYSDKISLCCWCCFPENQQYAESSPWSHSRLWHLTSRL